MADARTDDKLRWMRGAWQLIAALMLTVALSCGPDQTQPAGLASSITDGSPEAVKRKLRSFDGKPVVVNYWASWCSPCRKELPRFEEAAAAYRGRVMFLGVNVDDDARLADRFIQAYGEPFQSFALSRDEVRQLSPKWTGLPFTQFYDASGKLVSVHQGRIFADELGERIEELLG